MEHGELRIRLAGTARGDGRVIEAAGGNVRVREADIGQIYQGVDRTEETWASSRLGPPIAGADIARPRGRRQAGRMFWFRRKTFSGSYRRFSAWRRWYRCWP